MLNRVLKALAEAGAAGEPLEPAEQAAADVLIEAGFDSVDYITVRHAETLEPLRPSRSATPLPASSPPPGSAGPV